ncbi:MAG TPA: DnaB-like helicase C-terminal domain-containing protein [Nocardioides sp.]|nr:DnaB-like helicase C-terminal domain-containing protein [Nocardioides sp.]
MERVDQQLTTVGASLARSDERMLTGRNAAGRVWKTGFGGLDPLIGGGMRAGSLILLAGPQGLGKSTFALQVARNNAASGRPVLYFSYEHDAEDMTQKLLAMEAGELDDSDQVRMNSIRSIFDDLWVSSLDHRLESIPSGVEALAKVARYSEMLFVHRSTGTRTDLAAIQNAIEAVREIAGTTPLVIVDYLQKVKSSYRDDDERSTEVVEGLKDLAIDISAPILAIAAAEKEALRTGRRMRANDLRGSSALAYEADVVMVLNNKFDIVARHHLTYDLNNAERFREFAVLTVEKNRFGRDGVVLQFRTRFDQGRYESEGSEVKEQLIDERVFRE